MHTVINCNSFAVCGGEIAQIHKYTHKSFKTGLSYSKALNDNVICYFQSLTNQFVLLESWYWKDWASISYYFRRWPSNFDDEPES
jgi:hypothetical protein